jgi:hypothetical protein
MDFLGAGGPSRKEKRKFDDEIENRSFEIMKRPKESEGIITFSSNNLLTPPLPQMELPMPEIQIQEPTLMDVDDIVEEVSSTTSFTNSSQANNSFFHISFRQMPNRMLTMTSSSSSAMCAATISHPCAYCISRGGRQTSMCYYCERYCCVDTCLRQCDKCHNTFCSVCGLLDYSISFERFYCLDCYRR